MPAPLSIIIPTLNAAPDFALCLESLMAGVEAGLIHQVIIADGGSNDTTRAMAEMSGADFISSPPGRGHQLKVGANSI